MRDSMTWGHFVSAGVNIMVCFVLLNQWQDERGFGAGNKSWYGGCEPKMHHGVEDEISIGSVIESIFSMLFNTNVRMFDQITQSSSKDTNGQALRQLAAFNLNNTLILWWRRRQNSREWRKEKRLVSSCLQCLNCASVIQRCASRGSITQKGNSAVEGTRG